MKCLLRNISGGHAVRFAGVDSCNQKPCPGLPEGVPNRGGIVVHVFFGNAYRSYIRVYKKRKQTCMNSIL